MGRSLLECGMIRFHQERKYLLDTLRLLLEFDAADVDPEDSTVLESIKIFVAARLFQTGPQRPNFRVSGCMSAMTRIRTLLQRLGDKIAAAQTLGPGGMLDEMETIEFSRLSLIQQHELLGVVLCSCIEKRRAEEADFLDFVSTLKKVDKYDALLGAFPLLNLVTCDP